MRLHAVILITHGFHLAMIIGRVYTIECRSLMADSHIVEKTLETEPQYVHFNAGSKTLSFDFREGEEGTSVSINQTHIRAWQYKGMSRAN